MAQMIARLPVESGRFITFMAGARGEIRAVSMKRDIIIHIGPPKTGTTSLQYYFLEACAEAGPLAYPEIGRATNTREFFAHHNLARCFSVIPRVQEQYAAACGSPDDLVRHLRDDASDKPVLISSEGFWGLLLHEQSERGFTSFLASLRETLRVTVFVTWRNIVDFSLSMYFHAAKRHIPGQFPKPAERIEQLDARFWRNVVAISEVVDQVFVVQYSDDIVQLYRDIFGDVFRLNLKAPSPDSRKNPSLNSAQKMFALACSKAPDAFNVIEYRRIIRKLKTADFSGAVTLTLDGNLGRLRESSARAFDTFPPTPKIKLIGRDRADARVGSLIAEKPISALT